MAVRNWLAGSLAVVIMLATLAGCQPTFLDKDTYTQAHAPLPRSLEENTCPIIDPVTKISSAPPTVSQADRPPRYLTLQEALALALESGTVSGRAISNLLLIQSPGSGPPATNAIGFSVTAQNDSIRVLALQPAVTNAAMEISGARFDTIAYTGVNYLGLDGIPGVPNLGSNFQNSSLFANGGQNEGGLGSRADMALVKALPNGGIATVFSQMDYRALNNNGVNPVPTFGLFNPQYQVRMGLGYEMPLWRDSGVGINQILPLFPSPTGLGFASTGASTAFGQHQSKLAGLPGGTDGILIARLKFDQSRAHFENTINTMLANVEIAYWNLYNKYGQLYSYEDSVRIIHKAWQEAHDRHVLGGGDEEKGTGPSQYYQTLGQYNEFRGERMRALNEVIEAERNLRSILGLPPDDGSRLVPITPPTMSHMKPNFNGCIREALSSRPDLAWARQEVTKVQMALQVQRNNLRPDVRAYFRYEPFGDGSTLTGTGTYIDGTGASQPSNAFRSLMGGGLADWQVGIAANMPLGFRAEFAAYRAARLELTKTYLVLRDWENQVVFQVTKEFHDLEYWYKEIMLHRLERKAYGESVQKRLDAIELGKKQISDPQFLEAHRRYTAAIVKEYQAIAEYNNSMARLEWAKGSMMRYDNVHIAEGALPQVAQFRAVEYEKERSRSLALKQRPDALNQPGRWCLSKDSEPTSLDTLPHEDKMPLPNYELEPTGFEKKAPPSNEKKAPPSTVAPAKSLPAITTVPSSAPAPLPLPPVKTVPVETQGNVKPIEFRPSQSSSPAPLPKLEISPIPVIPPNIDLIPLPGGAKPIVISSVIEPKKSDTPAFVLMDDAQTPSPLPPPTVVRAAIGGPQFDVTPDRK